MTNPAPAPKHNHQLQHDASVSNPFATPSLEPADLPTPPQPTAQISLSWDCQSAHETNSRPSTLHGGLNNDASAYPYNSGSMSSNGTISSTSRFSSIDWEKSEGETTRQKGHKSSKPRQSRERRSRDPEKALPSRARGSLDRRPIMDRIAYLEEDEAEESRQMQESKAVRILLFLSGPVVVLSLLNALWTLISVLITSLAQPVRLCARRPTFGEQLAGLLGPSLNLQLKSIYTPLPPHADEAFSYRAGMLLAVQLLSPFHSMGIMLAALVVWIYWISSAVVGDPVGTDKRDDGRETALMLRGWWERWLVRSMKDVNLE